jgi:hypothetical protein
MAPTLFPILRSYNPSRAGVVVPGRFRQPRVPPSVTPPVTNHIRRIV